MSHTCTVRKLFVREPQTKDIHPVVVIQMSQQKICFLHDNSPDSLLNLSLEYIIANLDLYTESDVRKDCWRLKGDIILPAEICERFLEVYQR
ncbi:jg24196, partial [Pararge aegeria aegeria]